MKKFRPLRFIFALIASLIGLSTVCISLILGGLYLDDARDQSALKSEGIVTTAQITNSTTDKNDCFQVQYRYLVNGKNYEPIDLIEVFLDLDQSFSRCLNHEDQVHAIQSGTIQIVYLPSSPSISWLEGPDYFDTNRMWSFAILFLGYALVVAIGFTFGWVKWLKSEK